MIAAAHVHGILHPPGFPLYTLLAGLFARIPWCSVAERVNLFSAVCDALAAALLCGAVGRWSGSAWAGVLAAGSFAFSAVIWPYAVTAEVFALDNLFVAGLLDLAVGTARETDHDRLRRRSVWTALWVGLGLADQPIFVFLGLPVLAYTILGQGRPSPRRLLAPALALAAGLLPYLGLVVAGARHPPLAWGDPSTLSGLLTHVLRREYGALNLASPEVGPAGGMVDRLLIFGRRFGATTLGVGPLLLLAALPSFKRGSPARALAAVWAAALALYLFSFAGLANLSLTDPVQLAVQDRFWQQGVLVLCAFMGLGAAEVVRRLGAAGRVAGPVVCLGLPLALLVTQFRAMDQSQHRFFRNYGVAILESLPPDAILLVTSDEAIGSVRYLQIVEGLRRDVSVLPTGQATSPWFRTFAAHHLPGVVLPPPPFRAREFMDANVPRHPVYLLNKVPWLQTLEEAYSPWPFGLADRVLPRGIVPDLEPWAQEAEAGFARLDPRAASEGAWERYVAESYWKQYQRFGTALARAAVGRGGDPDAAETVARALETLVARHPSPHPTVFKNLGVAYQFLSRTRPETREGMRRHWRHYLAVGPQADPDRAAIRALVEDEAGTSPSRR